MDAPRFTFGDLLWNAFLVLLFVGLIAGLVLIIHRFGPGSGRDDIDERTTRLAEGDGDRFRAEGESGWAAFERFCYELMRDPDPSRAVRVVMRYAETGMGRLPNRIADETPNEWLRRTKAEHGDLGHYLAPIIASYNSVRFGGSGASPAERDAAVEALRRLARAACGDVPPETPDAVGSRSLT